MKNPVARSSPVLVLCGILLAAPPAFGQEAMRRVSLAEALEEFAENSLALKIARSEAAGLIGAARQSRGLLQSLARL